VPDNVTERPRTIVHAAGEMAPHVKVGGLADVVGALAAEQSRRGHRVTVALPWYRVVQIPDTWRRTRLGTGDVPWGMGSEPADFMLCEPEGGGPSVLLVGHNGARRFFDRPGVYDDPATGEGYGDGAERFLFFCRATLLGLGRIGEPVDVLHAHDQHAGWIPCLVRAGPGERAVFTRTATVFTIHNLGYQGIHDPWVLGLAGIGSDLFFPASPFEFWGRVNTLKIGISFADMLSTVSPRYAEEIRSTPEFGHGLEGVLAARAADLRGILNGIDPREWDPAHDPHLPRGYDADRLEGKADARRALAAACGFPADSPWPIVGLVTRLAEQKGLDLIEEARAEIARMDVRVVVLGVGRPSYEEMLRALAAAHPDRIHFRRAQDEAFAHLIEGGADLFLMPSRYEPCGLNQMYSMRYGTPPVVRAVGGLADTVEEFDPRSGRGTGFRFEDYEPAAMLEALRRAIGMFRQPEQWRILQRNGMARDFSWTASAARYDALYDEAEARVAAGRTRTLERVRVGR
jgi:starch synthase